MGSGFRELESDYEEYPEKKIRKKNRCGYFTRVLTCVSLERTRIIKLKIIMILI